MWSYSLLLYIKVTKCHRRKKGLLIYPFHWPPVLVPKGRARFGQHQESQSLGRSNVLTMRRVIVSYSQPIRFVRLDYELAQSDGKSVNRGLSVLGKAKGRDSWCWPKGARPLGTRRGGTHFHLNGFARRLVLTQRQKSTRKWYIMIPGLLTINADV